MTHWAIDFDSVLADFNGHICLTLQWTFGDTLTVEDINEWNFWTDHEREYFVWGEDCFYSREWTLSVPPVRGALGALRQLKEQGDHLVVVSDRLHDMQPWLVAWLTQYGHGDIDVVTTNKDISKTQIAWDLGLTHAIDDSPHWVDAYAQADFMEQVYVLDYAYNRGVEESDKVHRVQSWQHLIGHRLVTV